METELNRAVTCAMAALALLLTGSCQHTENDILAVADGHSSTGITNAGSDNLQPPDLFEETHETHDVATAPLAEWPELPADDIARLHRGMTRAELIELLGDPLRKETAVQGIDAGDERDWNAEIYTWKYQDSRLTSLEMVRDFEVRLAYLYRNQPFPGREGLVGPEWVVLGWSLF